MATKNKPKSRKTKDYQDMGPSEFADLIKPLLADARQAYGSQPAGSPSRKASDKVNEYILMYMSTGQKMPALAEALDGELSLSGLRRRVRVAKAKQLAGPDEVNLGRVKRPRGSTDEKQVAAAAKKINKARAVGGRVYGDAVREAYDDGIALQAIANEIGISYFALWAARRSAY